MDREPPPLLPLPSKRHLTWHEDDLTVFIHFGMNTFTGLSTGTGAEDPHLFMPADLDCEQWARESKTAGFKGIVLTAKHHDGFCLWPTQTTRHSVASCGWRHGKGDVVRDLASACRKYGLKFGIYCSPWDRNMDSRVNLEEYGSLYRQQLRELLSNYGEIYEMWFDGNNANVPNWDEIIQLVRSLQPEAIIKEGPRVRPVSSDVRWVGNEMACARLANWCVYPEPGNTGDETPIWFPVEADTSMVGRWFWADTLPLDIPTLMNFYYTSVGRGSVFLMNIAPDRNGKFNSATAHRLHEYAAAIRQIYELDLARLPEVSVSSSKVRGDEARFSADKVVDGDNSTYWATDDCITSAELVIDLGQPKDFNVIRIEEPIRLGQRIARYRIDYWDEQAAQWKCANDKGYTIGRRKLDRIPRIASSKVRITILESRACPLIQSVGIHLDEVSPSSHFDTTFANAEAASRSKMPEQTPITARSHELRLKQPR